jgi:hypothetical protein
MYSTGLVKVALHVKPVNGVDQMSKAVLEWLCPSNINPKEDQDLRRELFTKNTGNWIFKHEAYREWHAKPASFLWLRGQSKMPLDIADTVSGLWEIDAHVLTLFE